MPRANLLIVVVDGLRASALGAYGNTTFPTPALDRFAADSLLCDWCYSPTVDLGGIYQSLWFSLHPARSWGGNTLSAGGDSPSNSLPKLFAERGYLTTLVSDEPQLASFDGADDFHNQVQVNSDTPSSVSQRRAGDELETDLARVFAAAGESIGGQRATGGQSTGARRPQLVWLHARGMSGPWDAPLDCQESLRDEGDPPPVESVEPPDFDVAADGDPDAVFRYSCAYAAQVIALDACWQGLLGSVDSVAADQPWLVILLGARGFPLGEHARIGGVDSRLYSEQLHVPWLIRFPDGHGCLARESQLTTHLDMLPTLHDWTGGGTSDQGSCIDGVNILRPANDASPTSRDTLLSVTRKSAYAIRSPAWCLRGSDLRPSDAEAEAEPPELFVRPDDRWEANDVSKLCPEVVEELHAAAQESLRRYTLKP
jgi:arylsulfatase A-like enzyme